MTPTIRHVKLAAADLYGMTPEDLDSSRKAREYSHPRQVAFAAARRITGASLSQIGRVFGRRDHSTVSSGVAAIMGRRDPEDMEALAIIERRACEMADIINAAPFRSRRAKQ